MIDEARIRHLNRNERQSGRYVLYWMQASQRTVFNHALEYAVELSNELKQPLVVCFGLTDRFPEANGRHYQFMLQGLREVKASLNDRGIGMVIRAQPPDEVTLSLSGEALLVVCDRGYLRIQREWRDRVAGRIECPLIEVETDAVVPVDLVSGKEEYSAATLRRKILPLLPRFIQPVESATPHIDSTRMVFEGIDIENLESVLSSLGVDRSVMPVEGAVGGMNRADILLSDFIEHRLERYEDTKNDPNEDGCSGLSPYLHFGQISPVHITLKLEGMHGAGAEAFLEELIVRRELSFNFVRFNRQYDAFSGLPAWAIKTLSEHRFDSREYLYRKDELERGGTHDRYWNAAQKQMVATGAMHGYMRMYWGKKLLEWSESPEIAYTTALYLNNKYSLDGRDPNSFAGVAWCFGKHDRPWARRPVFGNIRYMNANGLKRRFDIERYAEKYG
ncbi:MAG: deoxyribodipyrimidine photolyase [Dehalococcoidales bacterium]|nr:deoxyribodipyrimidine photolyase [Dehalococcoidales bacterium]